MSEQKLQLKYPFKTGLGVEVAELTLRRPKVRDLKLAQRHGKDAASVELAMIGMVCEPKLTPEDMEAMDLADYRAITMFLEDSSD